MSLSTRSISREGVIRETVERAAKESVAGTGITISRFDYRKTRWKSFDLDLVVTSAANEGRELVILGTQLPLATDAIQINLLGPAADEPRLLADLEELLGSFEGKSNWLTDKERSERMGKAFVEMAEAADRAKAPEGEREDVSPPREATHAS